MYFTGDIKHLFKEFSGSGDGLAYGLSYISGSGYGCGYSLAYGYSYRSGCGYGYKHKHKHKDIKQDIDLNDYLGGI